MHYFKDDLDYIKKSANALINQDNNISFFERNVRPEQRAIISEFKDVLNSVGNAEKFEKIYFNDYDSLDLYLLHTLPANYGKNSPYADSWISYLKQYHPDLVTEVPDTAGKIARTDKEINWELTFEKFLRDKGCYECYCIARKSYLARCHKNNSTARNVFNNKPEEFLLFAFNWKNDTPKGVRSKIWDDLHEEWKQRVKEIKRDESKNRPSNLPDQIYVDQCVRFEKLLKYHGLFFNFKYVAKTIYNVTWQELLEPTGVFFWATKAFDLSGPAEAEAWKKMESDWDSVCNKWDFT